MNEDIDGDTSDCVAYDLIKCYRSAMYDPIEEWLTFDFNDVWEDYGYAPLRENESKAQPQDRWLQSDAANPALHRHRFLCGQPLLLFSLRVSAAAILAAFSRTGLADPSDADCIWMDGIGCEGKAASGMRKNHGRVRVCLCPS